MFFFPIQYHKREQLFSFVAAVCVGHQLAYRFHPIALCTIITLSRS